MNNNLPKPPFALSPTLLLFSIICLAGTSSLEANQLSVELSAKNEESTVTANASQSNQDEKLQAIERIIVTADLSQRDLSQLPAAALLVTQENIKNRQARHLQDIVGMVPNVNFSSGASRGKFIQIRGMGERSQFAEPVNPSIGLFIDDIDISGIGGLATLYDLRQVEVLSGPQSVASGVNSVGGIIKLVSNAPTSSTYANLTASYAQYNESQLAATFSSSITQSVNTRLSVQQTKGDGFIKNDFLNRDDTNAINETSATALTTFQLNANSEIAVNLYKFDIDNGYDAFSLDNTVTLSDQPGFDRLDASAASIKYSYNFAKHSLKLSGYILDVDTQYGFDEDWTFVDLHPDTYSSVDFYDRGIKRKGLDLKVASTPLAGQNSYLLGASMTDNEENLLRQNTFLAQDYQLIYEPSNYSVFGQYVIVLNEAAKITTAGRIERFSADFEDAQGFTNISDTLVAASLAIDYKLSSNLLFASVSRGYKAGGFNVDDRIPVNDRVFDPEYNINYELGIKGTGFDDMARLNLTFFYMQRDEAQVSDSVLFETPSSEQVQFVDGIGNADSGINKGIEFLGSWSFSDNWEVQTNVGYLDSTFGGYTRLDGIFVDIQEQAHAPKYTAHIASTWQITDSLTWFVDLDVKDDFKLGTNHEFRAPSVAVFNSELIWRSHATHSYSVKIWIKNITDENVVTRGFGSFPNDPRDGYTTNGPYFQFGQPRQIGLTFNYEWE
jgi:outer membrane receptor protein involved in Fe transport